MGGFAGADGFFVSAVDELDFHLGHFREFQYRIGFPGVALNAGAVEAHRFLERPAYRLDGAAFDLVAHAVRVDDQAYVHRDPEFFNTHFATGVDLRHHRTVGAAVFVFGEGDAHAAAFGFFTLVTPGPAGHFCRRFEHGAAARVFEVAQAVLERIDAQLQRDFVEKGLDGKDIAMAA